MFLSNLSIKRPVFATVIMLALVTLGLFSYRRLAIDMFPDVEFPMISIFTVFPGASPETVEREVLQAHRGGGQPHPGREARLLHLPRGPLLASWWSSSSSVKVNEASQEARAKINAIRNELPQGIEEPVIQKMDFNAMPIISLAVRSAVPRSAGPDDAGRPKDQAPPREHPGRRQGEAGGTVQARGARRAGPRSRTRPWGWAWTRSSPGSPRRTSTRPWGG